MRSRADAALTGIALTAVLVAAPSVRAGRIQRESDRATSAVPSHDDIARARDIVKADPNLSTERTIKTLRWTRSNARTGRAAWLEWLIELFRWVDRSARALVWCAALLLAGLIVVSIVRMARSYRPSTRDDDAFVVPTHVRDLDIRPETLPSDVGAAARELWDAGACRAALALLYRALLSRLAHVHGLLIRDSTTEGDCLSLTANLARARHEYASQLVRAWQRHTYGRQDVQTVIVHGLCDDFASMLDAASPQGSGAPREVA